MAFWFAILAPVAHLFISARAEAWDEAIESVMYRSPELPKARKVEIFSEELKTIWLAALKRPEADYQYQAALTIVLARQHGMKGLETTVAPLLESLERVDQQPRVRLAIARALIELNARSAAGALFDQAQLGDGSLRWLVEPTLASWDYKPAREVWLQRLRQLEYSNDDLLLAVNGLGTVGDARAKSRLRALIFSQDAPAPLRLEAARALGNIFTSGLEQDAHTLLSDLSENRRSQTTVISIADRLAAVLLLRHHQGDQAVQLLLSLARDPESAVAAFALARLAEINPKLVLPAIDQLLDDSDAAIRSIVINIVVVTQAEKHFGWLVGLFHEAHPTMRVKARRALLELAANPKFRSAIIDSAMKELVGGDWRGLEQTVILLTHLDHKAAASRFAELLKSNRPEVSVAAAWGLRRLADKGTLPLALAHFREMTRSGASYPPDLSVEALDQQLSQLAQFFGESKYESADTALRPMMLWPPRAGVQTRAASIWALGLILEGKPLGEIAAALEARLDAPRRWEREDYRVRWMSAVTLGRMKAADRLPMLRLYYSAGKASLDPVNNACGWAIQCITGEVMPSPAEIEVAGEPFDNWLRSLQ
jgi:hypothetical protein